MRGGADDAKKIMVLGGGPNRIGQGIEFDYCCVHAALALREDGFETIMVNCNPETVSTDYDTSDRLYFEPLTLEDVLEIVDREQPAGVIVQFGGQTPLKLARAAGGGRRADHRHQPRFDRPGRGPRTLPGDDRAPGLRQPPNRTARSIEEAVRLAAEIGYPLVVRPSYVLGGRAMDIVRRGRTAALHEAGGAVSNDSPVLLDRFLDHAKEVDVDAVCDGETC
jgi:carbamoyl-phosphate synthase large subunit